MNYRTSTFGSIEDKGLLRGIPIKVYKNKDQFFPGKRVVVNQRKQPTFDSFMQELTYRLRLPRAVRCLYTPEHGTRVRAYDQIDPDKEYVASWN